MPQIIVKMWKFGSESKPTAKPYETLLYDDGKTSCNCKGWINGGKRLDANGNRTCRHTRMVDDGTADSEALNVKDYRTTQTVAPVQAPVKAKPTKAHKQTYEEPETPTSVVRKIQW